MYRIFFEVVARVLFKPVQVSGAAFGVMAFRNCGLHLLDKCPEFGGVGGHSQL